MAKQSPEITTKVGDIYSDYYQTEVIYHGIDVVKVHTSNSLILYKRGKEFFGNYITSSVQGVKAAIFGPPWIEKNILDNGRRLTKEEAVLYLITGKVIDTKDDNAD